MIQHMPLFEMDFKFRHDCRLGNLSTRYPSLKIITWRILDREIIELIPEGTIEHTDLINDIQNLDEIIEYHVTDGKRIHLFSNVSPCAVEEIINESIETLDLLPVWPISYCKGWEYHRIITFKHEDINKLIERFQERGYVPWILRKVPFNGFSGGQMTLTADTLFSSITHKQMDALLTAYANGYYKLPRESDVQTIAEKIQMPRTTFQEHLKKAENKIVNALVPHIHTWFHYTGGKGFHPVIDETTSPRNSI